MPRAGHLLRQALLLPMFRNSSSYWERRYRLGVTSGEGSYGKLAAFKARIINDLVRQMGIETVIEFGCGDGNQLTLAHYPRYLGLDISKSAIMTCRERFQGDTRKSFLWYDPAAAVNIGAFIKADLILSLDVIYHLVETEVYLRYLDGLFTSAIRFVLIYSSNEEQSQLVPHVRHRVFTRDVEARFPEMRLTRVVENQYPEESICRFFLFEHT